MRCSSCRIALRRIATSQLDRIDGKLMRKLVHGALDGEGAGRLSGAAHEGVCHHVEVDMVLDDIKAVTRIKRSPGQAVLLVANTVLGLHRVAVMQQRLELSFGIGRQRDTLLRLSSAADEASDACPR